MAKNTGNGFRKGSVTDRTQVKGGQGQIVKRDRTNGQIIDNKSGEKPFKGVAKEPDGRQDK
jgi:hypothetical protein